MTEIARDTNERPDELTGEILSQTRLAKRSLIKQGDPARAKRRFQRARQLNVSVVATIGDEYGLEPRELQETIGYDIQNTNDDLMKLVKKMGAAEIERQKTADRTAKIKRNTLMEIEEVISEIEQFHDLIVGLEEGTTRIRRSE